MWTLPATSQFHPQRAWPGSPIEWAEEHGSRHEPGRSLPTADDSMWIFQSATPILPKWPPRSMRAIRAIDGSGFPSFLAGSGPRHDPCPSARPGEPGEGCGRGWPGCEQAGRDATCAAERPCRSVGRVPWGDGAALPRRPTQRGMLTGGRRRSARAIVTRSAETGPGLREGLQPRVERGRPWPARPTLKTRIALGISTAIARREFHIRRPDLESLQVATGWKRPALPSGLTVPPSSDDANSKEYGRRP